MERLSVLCLLLLFSSLSVAELLDNEIAEQREAGPERANASEQPQPCPPDVLAVLLDVSAKLSALQCKMEQQQTLNQEQAAKLKELQSQMNTQQQAQASEVDALKQQQQEQAAKLAKNEAGIQELHNLNQEQAAKLKDVDTQQQAHATELRSLKTRTNVTENQVEFLRKDRDVAQVAFSASLLASGSGYTGPINAHTTLVFRRVVSNIGNAYNPHTGFFIAPVRGAYHFEYYFAATSGSITSAVALVKNGEGIIIAWEHQTNGWGSSANGATLLLEAGDVVFLRLWANTRIYDDPDHYSTFSGHLLFPM